MTAIDLDIRSEAEAFVRTSPELSTLSSTEKICTLSRGKIATCLSCIAMHFGAVTSVGEHLEEAKNLTKGELIDHLAGPWADQEFKQAA